jgi:hypothetical protein
MGEDIVSFTREQLRARVKEFTNVLKVDKTLSPETKAAVKSWIDQINGLLHQTDNTSIKTLELSADFGEIANGLNDISGALSGVDDTLSQMIGTISKLSGAISSSLKSLDTLKDPGATAANKIGAIGGIFGTVFNVFSTIQNIINSASEKRQQLKEQEANALVTVEQGEIAINDEYRKRLLLQAQITELKLKGIQEEADALKVNKDTIIQDYNKILKDIQQQGKVALPEGFTARDIKNFQDVNYRETHYGFYKSYIEATSLANKSFDDLNRLFNEGRLDDRAKQLFQTLKQLKQEGEDVDALILQNKKDAQETFTGTTSDAILDSIVQGFAQGKRATADFADDFQKLMQEAILNSLKYQTLEVPLKKFYEQFADAAKSDGVLTAAEIASLKDSYNATITAASQQFEELQKITKINFNSSVSNDNSLSGAIKGITEQTAQLLAGQFGGLRITAFDQLSVARSQLTALNQIVFNTSLIATTNEILRKIDTYGLKIK